MQFVQTLSILSFAALALSAQTTLDVALLSRYQAQGAEIFQYDPRSQRIYATASDSVPGVEMIDYSDPRKPTRIGLIDFREAFASTELDSVSSVAIDPTDRGLGAAALIPKNSNEHRGRVGLFNMRTGALLGYVEVGYHPDSLAFSPDGQKILIANEGEFTMRDPQAPGSISVIDLSQLRSLDEFVGLAAETYGFSSQYLARGVDLSKLRSNQPGATPESFLEPEYVIGLGQKAFVSIQENNAIGVFDTELKQWVAVHDLLLRTHDIDTSDRDGQAALFVTKPEARIFHIPMPDMIAAYAVNGRNYILTANEGDARPDGLDAARVQDLGQQGLPPLNRAYKSTLSKLYGRHVFKNSNLGRLEVSIVDGLNEKGEIAKLHTFGSRSFSIIDAESGEIVFDSGSDFELLSAQFGGQNYNANQEAGDFDSRSDAKGPEPEAITVGTIGGRSLAFIAMERSGFVFIYDITVPGRAHCIGMFDSLGEDGLDTAPEFMKFISAEKNASGLNLLLIGFEKSRTIVAYSLLL
jgi:hypothetical protein